MVHVHNEILFSHEKGGYLAVWDNMSGPWAQDIKQVKSENDKYCMMSLIYIESKKQK